MGEARWADVATAGLGGGPGRKQSRSGHCVGTLAKGRSAGSWGLCRERGHQNDNQLGGKEGIPHPTDSSRIVEAQCGRVWELEEAGCIMLRGPFSSRASFPGLPVCAGHRALHTPV